MQKSKVKQIQTYINDVEFIFLGNDNNRISKLSNTDILNKIQRGQYLFDQKEKSFLMMRMSIVPYKNMIIISSPEFEHFDLANYLEYDIFKSVRGYVNHYLSDKLVIQDLCCQEYYPSRKRSTIVESKIFDESVDLIKNAGIEKFKIERFSRGYNR